MGEGNWLPTEHAINEQAAEFVFVGNDSIFHLNTPDWVGDRDIEWQEFLHGLKGLLPRSFSGCDEWRARDEHVIARNGLFELVVCQQDPHTAVCLQARDGAPSFAPALVHKLAKKLFDGLVDIGHDLRVRDGAWMTSPYKS